MLIRGLIRSHYLSKKTLYIPLFEHIKIHIILATNFINGKKIGKAYIYSLKKNFIN